MMIYGADSVLQKKIEALQQRPTNKAFTVIEMRKIQRTAQKMKTNVVFLADEFGCGVDISFGVNPKVAILCEEEAPSRYQFLQYAGRAQRGDLYPICTVFSTTGMDSADAVKGEIMAEDKAPLKEMEQCLDLYQQHEAKI